jgi:hypothetical protein
LISKYQEGPVNPHEHHQKEEKNEKEKERKEERERGRERERERERKTRPTVCPSSYWLPHKAIIMGWFQ